jgi:hypothetical protein
MMGLLHILSLEVCAEHRNSVVAARERTCFQKVSPPTEIEGAAFSWRGGCQRLAGSASHHINGSSTDRENKEVPVKTTVFISHMLFKPKRRS